MPDNPDYEQFLPVDDRINAWKPILNALTIHYGDRIQAAS